MSLIATVWRKEKWELSVTAEQALLQPEFRSTRICMVSRRARFEGKWENVHN